MAPCVWESPEAIAGRNNLGEVTAVWKSDPARNTPNLQSFVVEQAYASPEASSEPLPTQGWSLTTAVLRPSSRGRVRLSGPAPSNPVEIDANLLDKADDLDTLKTCIEFCRTVGNSAPLRRFAKREVLPGNVNGKALETFMRNGTVSHSHQSCTAKMGRDAMSVVNRHLQVYGINRLRIADASVMPRITAGNTMAPSVVIGERAGEILKAAYGL